jgi:peroxiredoxin Q/BCP
MFKRDSLFVCAITLALAACGGPTADGAAGSSPAKAPAAVSPVGGVPAATGIPGPEAVPTVAIQEGAPAPDVKAKASDGKVIDLRALKGHPVVVYFYPKDETPGCTKEACAFRDAWNDLQKAGVVMIGVSTDTDESHRGFAEHHKLPFHLVSDADGAIAKAFGVPVEGGYTARQSFVIGADGNVKKIFRKVDVGAHAQEIMAAVKQ